MVGFPTMTSEQAVAKLGPLVNDVSGASEVTRLIRPLVVLVVAVERVGRVGDLSVGLEAPPAGLDGVAVSAVAAGVVQRRLKARVPDRLVRHAPARPVPAAGFWLLVDNSTGTSEVARHTGAAIFLVVAVECVGRVRNHGVGLVARLARLDGTAVRPVAARKVERRLEPLVPDRRVRRAPAVSWGRGRDRVREVDLIHRRPVRVEEAEVFLLFIAGLQVFVEKGEDVDGNAGVGLVRCAGT